MFVDPVFKRDKFPALNQFIPDAVVLIPFPDAALHVYGSPAVLDPARPPVWGLWDRVVEVGQSPPAKYAAFGVFYRDAVAVCEKGNVCGIGAV